MDIDEIPLTFQDPERWGQVTKATLQQEKRWYAKSINTDVESLKTLPVGKKLCSFESQPGKTPTRDNVTAAINRVRSTQYGVPGFALADKIDEPTKVPDVSIVNKGKEILT